MWRQASGPPQLETLAGTMRLNGARMKGEENSQWGKAGLGWEGHEVTALFPQVCHGRDEPPRVPCGELVWRTLQTASL